MGDLDPRSAVSGIIRILRKVTRVVQFIPFVYLLLFAVVSVTEPYMSDRLFNVVNELFYVSPAIVVFMLFFSRLLRLCWWHKTACLIPMLAQVENYIDAYVFEFTQGEIIIINTAIGAISLLFIILTFKHFFYGREENAPGNA